MANLLRNPSFKEFPLVRVALPFISGAWAPGWTLAWYYKPDDPVLGPTGSRWMLPEMIVQEMGKQVPEPWLQFDPTDPFVFHCFWNGATGFAWRQTVNAPAGLVKFVVPVLPDQWHIIPLAKWLEIKQADPSQNDPRYNRMDGDGSSTWQVRPSRFTSDDWYLGSEVFAKISTSGREAFTGWLDARAVPYGKYTPLSVAVDHPGGDLTVEWGCRGRWPFRSNGWFIDGLSLERVGEPAPTPAPQPPLDQFAAIRGSLLKIQDDLRRNRQTTDAMYQDQLANIDDALGMIDHILASAEGH